MEHVLCHDSILFELRGAMLGDHWLNTVMIVGAPASSLIQFILNTDLTGLWGGDAGTKNDGSAMGLRNPMCREPKNVPSSRSIQNQT